MPTDSPIPINCSIVKAWHDYKATEAFQFARRWALFPDNVDGSLWTMFLAGYEARAKEEGYVNKEIAPDPTRSLPIIFKRKKENECTVD